MLFFLIIKNVIGFIDVLVLELLLNGKIELLVFGFNEEYLLFLDVKLNDNFEIGIM